jgi:flagellar hook-basal body complex protein FliE
MSPIDAFSALTQAQLPTTGAVGINANPPAGAVPVGASAPVSESFGQNLLNSLNTQEILNPQSLQAVAPQAVGGASPTTWGHMVQQMVMDVNNKQHDAGSMVNDVLKGGPTPVHQAMIATEEAGLSFEFLTEVRNKVLDAYNQIMQMQV